MDGNVVCVLDVRGWAAELFCALIRGSEDVGELLVVFLGDKAYVHGRLMMGKYGIVFSGDRPSRLAASLLKCGQLVRSELACVEVGPQDTQWGVLRLVQERVLCF